MAHSLRIERVHQTARIPPDMPGEYVVSLRITDPNGVSDPDYVVITITSDDLRPIADCGPDTYGQVGQAGVWTAAPRRTQRGSRLHLGRIIRTRMLATRVWKHLRRGTATPSVIPDCQGLFVMSLVVDDGLQWSEPDYCTIDVRSDNRSPVAESGPGGVVPPCDANPFQLSGWESYDPDGDPLDYNWSVVSAPAGADPSAYGFVDPSVVAPFFGWDVPGNDLQLRERRKSVVQPRHRHLRVSAEGENNSPTANAGGDQTVIVEANCSTSSYVWTCEQCLRPQSHSMAPARRIDGDTLSYSWSEDSDADMVEQQRAGRHRRAAPQDAEYEVDLSTDYDIELSVNDCTLSDTDSITLTHICRGIYVPPEVP